MSRRFRLGVAHLAIGSFVVGFVLMALYFGWYQWPNWWLAGADRLVLMIVVVDVVLGPCLTLIVASSKKTLQELRRDVAVIALVQVMALAYGVVSLWQGRPLFAVFAVDRVELVTASMLDERDLSEARSIHSAYVPDWRTTPSLVALVLPKDPAIRSGLIWRELGDGVTAAALPQYWQPLSSVADRFRAKLHSVNSLRDKLAFAPGGYEAALSKIGLPESRLGLIPFSGRGRDGAMVVDVVTLKPVGFWAVSIF